jgi:hypothetical protein
MSTDDRYESPDISPQIWVLRNECPDRYQSSDMSPRIWVLWVLTGQIWADMYESPDMSSHIWVLKYPSSDMSPQIWVSRYVRVPRYESWLLRYQYSDMSPPQTHVRGRYESPADSWVVITTRHRYISDYANEGESAVWVHRATRRMHHVRTP